jgi:RNA polymerase subunit RPABC4/transcription elongation factor Spt4
MSDGPDGPIHDFIKKVCENTTNVPDRVKNACPKCGSEKPMNPWFDYCFDCTLKVAHQRASKTRRR